MVFSEMLLTDLVIFIATLSVGVFLFLKWKLSYWDRVGIPTLSPSLIFGDFKNVFLGRYSLGEQYLSFYKQIRAKGEKLAGVYMGPRAMFVPTDPELIKNMIQRDFAHFMNHGNFIDEENDPLTGHLFNLEDTKWRNMRVKLTPTFTSGKMKMMFQTFVDCTEGLKTIMDQASEKGAAFEVKDVLSRFTTDIIGSCAFGLDCNSLKDPDAEFRKFGRRIFDFNLKRRLKFLTQFIVPAGILKALKFKVFEPDMEEFFMKAIKDTVSYREKHNVYRKDFMHLLLQLKNRGHIKDDEHVTDPDNTSQEKALTINELAAQCLVFFIAGFETSSTTMTFALYELASNPDVQEKLRSEINTIFAKHDGKLTYDAIMEMTYMDNILAETLRKYPPVPALPRICTKDYQIPGTNSVLRKGDKVTISILGLHSDPEYYPKPEKFDPDRFLEKNKSTRPAFTWIPFGEGPRLCIGMRFGLMQSKVGLFTLLKNYKISLGEKTQVPLTFDKKAFISTAEGGVWIKVEKL